MLTNPRTLFVSQHSLSSDHLSTCEDLPFRKREQLIWLSFCIFVLVKSYWVGKFLGIHITWRLGLTYYIRDFRCSCYAETHMAGLLFCANHSTIHKYTVKLKYIQWLQLAIKNYSNYQMSILCINEATQNKTHESESHLWQVLFEPLLKFPWMYAGVIT